MIKWHEMDSLQGVQLVKIPCLLIYDFWFYGVKKYGD